MSCKNTSPPLYSAKMRSTSRRRYRDIGICVSSTSSPNIIVAIVLLCSSNWISSSPTLDCALCAPVWTRHDPQADAANRGLLLAPVLRTLRMSIHKKELSKKYFVLKKQLSHHAIEIRTVHPSIRSVAVAVAGCGYMLTTNINEVKPIMVHV